MIDEKLILRFENILTGVPISRTHVERILGSSFLFFGFFLEKIGEGNSFGDGVQMKGATQ